MKFLKQLTFKDIVFVIYKLSLWAGVFCLFPSLFFFIFVNKRIIWEKPIFFEFSNNFNTFLNFSSSFLAIIMSYYFLQAIIKKLNIKSNKATYSIFISISFLYFLFSAVRIPFSPNHDAGDMFVFLSMLIKGEALDSYSTAYLIFTVTNKLALYTYLPLAKLLGNVMLAVKIQNAILLFGSCMLVSLVCGRLFGENARNFSVLICVVWSPYMLLAGPYIYLPSIFLTSLIFYLYLSKNKYIKIISFLLCGLLYAIRPLALGCVLTFIFFDILYRIITEKKALKTIFEAVVLSLCIMLINTSTGALLFKTGLHPYPGLHNNAALWAMELGTRFTDYSVGLCTYTAYKPIPDDEIAKGMNHIWKLYENNNPDDYSAIITKQKEIKKMIAERTKKTVIKSPKRFMNYIKYKYYNLFSDNYIPYYYSAKISNENFQDEIYQNFHEKFFLNFNVLLTAFCMSSITIIIKILRKKDNYLHEDFRLAGLIFGCMAVSIVIILLTEVMKKYTLDFFVPLMICVSYFACLIQNKLFKVYNLKAYVRLASLALISVAISHLTYNRYNIDVFKNSLCVMEGNQLSITFNNSSKSDGYNIIQYNGNVIDLTSEKSISIYIGDKNYIAFDIQTPQGKTYHVYK